MRQQEQIEVPEWVDSIAKQIKEARLTLDTKEGQFLEFAQTHGVVAAMEMRGNVMASVDGVWRLYQEIQSVLIDTRKLDERARAQAVLDRLAAMKEEAFAEAQNSALTGGVCEAVKMRRLSGFIDALRRLDHAGRIKQIIEEAGVLQPKADDIPDSEKRFRANGEDYSFSQLAKENASILPLIRWMGVAEVGEICPHLKPKVERIK